MDVPQKYDVVISAAVSSPADYCGFVHKWQKSAQRFFSCVACLKHSHISHSVRVIRV